MEEAKQIELLHDCLQRAEIANESGQIFCANTKHWGIYGAGRIGKKLARALLAKGKSVDFFLDASAHTSELVLGIPCFRKESATDSARQTCVVVALHNPQIDARLIRRQLQADGFTNVLLLQEVVDFVPEISNFWLSPRKYSLDSKAILLAGLSLMSDDASRNTYVQILAFRLLGEEQPIPEPDQYFPASLPSPQLPLRFVDVGAFDGDTLDYIMDNELPLEWCMAFEPDTVNYAKLVAKHSRRATLVPCGLSDKMEDVRFFPDGSSGRIGDGDVVIRTVTLDSVLGLNNVNYIKMDIEGAEPAAIRGSRDTIVRCQPRIAVASYHDPLHMATLPAQLRNMGYEGAFHLRSHAWNSFETVLYGLPSGD
jgi:FkbM family methyltransferase